MDRSSVASISTGLVKSVKPLGTLIGNMRIPLFEMGDVLNDEGAWGSLRES